MEPRDKYENDDTVVWYDDEGDQHVAVKDGEGGTLPEVPNGTTEDE